MSPPGTNGASASARDHDRRPRLCMILHGRFPNDVRVAREVRVALEEGFEVDVIAVRGAVDAPGFEVDGAHVHRLPISRKRGARGLAFVGEYLGFATLATVVAARFARRRRYDVVHVNNPPDFLIVAALVPKLLGARVIFDVHDLSPDMFDMRFHGRRGGRAVERALLVIERAATRVADVVLTVHEPYRRELVGRGVPPEKTAVLMNSLDERLLPPVREPAPDGAFRVVYHGAMTPSYGVELLVEAAAALGERIPNLQITLYGGGDAAPSIRRRIDELGVADCVEMGGYLPHREVLERVRGASVGVIPNLPTRLNRFALSSKLFEYVALGIPVVSADLPTLREHFGDDELLYFRAGDAESLADALYAVAQDRAATALRAEAALRRYESYRWAVQAPRYADVLRRCVARNGHGHV